VECGSAQWLQWDPVVDARLWVGQLVGTAGGPAHGGNVLLRYDMGTLPAKPAAAVSLSLGDAAVKQGAACAVTVTRMHTTPRELAPAVGSKRPTSTASFSASHIVRWAAAGKLTLPRVHVSAAVAAGLDAPRPVALCNVALWEEDGAVVLPHRHPAVASHDWSGTSMQTVALAGTSGGVVRCIALAEGHPAARTSPPRLLWTCPLPDAVRGFVASAVGAGASSAVGAGASSAVGAGAFSAATRSTTLASQPTPTFSRPSIPTPAAVSLAPRTHWHTTQWAIVSVHADGTTGLVWAVTMFGIVAVREGGRGREGCTAALQAQVLAP